MIYQIDARRLIDYRAYRMEQRIKASTINHDLSAVNGVFKSMAEIDEFHGENPVSTIAVLKDLKTEMSYLTQSEVDNLLSMTKGDYYRIAVLLLATGVDGGEAH